METRNRNYVIKYNAFFLHYVTTSSEEIYNLRIYTNVTKHIWATDGQTSSYLGIS